MPFPDEQIAEMKALFPGVQLAQEGGCSYFLIPALQLPAGCTPATVDALFCPTGRDGYASRLFFAQMIAAPRSRNWNAQGIRILDRNWFAFSWNIKQNGLRLTQAITYHLSALVR